MKIRQVIHIALDTLFPPRCVGCKKVGELLCGACVSGARRFGSECLFCGGRSEKFNICGACGKKSRIDGVFWPMRYQAKITKKAVYNYKYGGKTSLAPALASIMGVEIKKLTSAHEREYFLVAIPLHPSKERERGFNQACLLADNIKIKSLPALKRVAASPPQARTPSRTERLKRLRGAFELSRADIVAGKNIIIIDDVATTGATLMEAARTLKKGGAKSIYAAVFAHG